MGGGGSIKKHTNEQKHFSLSYLYCIMVYYTVVNGQFKLYIFTLLVLRSTSWEAQKTEKYYL